MVAPLQVSTVLYVTQRMAILACLFSLVAMLAYLRVRLYALQSKSLVGWTLIGILAMSLAVFSKENAVVVLAIPLALETLWFRSYAGDEEIEQAWCKRVFWVTAVFLLGGLVLCSLYWSSLVAGYANRPFSFSERLITQCYILWDYIAQFYTPEMKRMGVYHDDVTLDWARTRSWIAIVGWSSLIALLALSPLHIAISRVAFCLVFFFICHGIESTVLPLEMYFEHRNYLPSVGLALLIPTIVWLFGRFGSVLVPPLIAVFCVYIVLQVASAGALVRYWSSSQLFTTFQLAGHPTSFRANTDFAYLLATVGGAEEALEYSKKAHFLSSESGADWLVRDAALICISKPSELQPLEAHYPRTITPDQLGAATGIHRLVRLLEDERCDARDFADFFLGLEVDAAQISEVDLSIDMSNLISRLLSVIGKKEAALVYLDTVLSQHPAHIRSRLMRLQYRLEVERYQIAAQDYRELVQLDEQDKMLDSERQTLSLYHEYFRTLNKARAN
ncbi:hypothetical protein GCM10007053_02570 [Halioglobus pacificus]|uniref:Tetratricopeptide repeat protein n=1 Tax=Parahalioglobus pacificus TaxID=930806 RepID=A0A919CHJ5_9GAMM|nr:hypothetical protein GCM10007053_02570 [Halioglobus pacificus]